MRRALRLSGRWVPAHRLPVEREDLRQGRDRIARRCQRRERPGLVRPGPQEHQRVEGDEGQGISAGVGQPQQRYLDGGLQGGLELNLRLRAKELT